MKLNLLGGKEMFDKEYSFKGSHAIKVNRLTASLSENNKDIKIFQRNIDVYVTAPLVGFLYSRKADVDKTTTDTAKIMGDRVINSKEDLKFNYRLIMLLDEKNESNAEERINKAFRYIDSEKSVFDEALFEDYVRGGIDVLYEKIIDKANSLDEYLTNLYDFLEEFEQRYNEAITSVDIIDLCKLART